MNWLAFVVMTVLCWGLYGVLLHTGVGAFSPATNPQARYEAFLFVGVAYFLTAVVAPLGMLVCQGSTWEFLRNTTGTTWSLLAGIVGAAGAFGVLLAFGAGGRPAVVMAIVFAGAPIVNAIVALLWHPPRAPIRWPFVLGIVLAAAGGALVTLYRPIDSPKARPPAVADEPQASER